MEERYNLAIDRMKAIIEEKTVAEPYREYFQHVARFWCWEENWEAFCLRFTPRFAEAFLMFRNSVWSML